MDDRSAEDPASRARGYSIIGVTNNFPEPRFPEKGAFVLNNLREMARQGARVDVIAPSSWVHGLKTLRNPARAVDLGSLRVFRPAVTTVPLRFSRRLKPTLTRFNDAAFRRAVERTVERTGTTHDFCYAHFFPSARAAVAPMRKRGVPVVLNLGESDPWDYDAVYGREAWVRELAGFAGIITVSRRNTAYLLERDPRLEPKVRHIPNGVDTSRFRPLPKRECRAKLGLPADAKIAIFCGYFDERKGPLRVLEALKRLGVHGIFLGSGSDRPEGPDVLFAGAVPASDVPLWLNAADVFVLPTLSEGMSNAILEALGCGLPLVVSDRDFNREFLTAACAQFVDPLDPDDIAMGISRCLEGDIAASMEVAALATATRYSISNRVASLFAFASEVIES